MIGFNQTEVPMAEAGIASTFAIQRATIPVERANSAQLRRHDDGPSR